uniref:Discs, large homolog 5b (Drosophila), tandem duplicate 1 n=1 Tax=Tetraodon nigroviridis TaxID=99883 RepID=H3D6K2_TETNG
LGIDVAEGVNDPYLPGDCGIVVTKVDKGSLAEGRLRVNDWLLKINDVDLTNKDRKQVIKAVLSGEGVINMVVRRSTPPASPAQTGSQAKGEMGNQLHYVDGPPRETKAPAEELIYIFVFLDSSTLQFRTERIKIPPARNPRSTGSDRAISWRRQEVSVAHSESEIISSFSAPPGSLSHSECSSPTPPMSPINLETSSFTSSQSQGSISAQPRISVSPVPAGDRRKPGNLFILMKKPYLEEPRNVTVQRGTEPLGISIVSGENGGVFVSKVTAGSIAHQAHLEYGDQLLEFNGINLRNANEQQARLVIGQQCDTVTILAQYNPHMFQLGNHSHSGMERVCENSFRGAGVGMLPTAEPRLSVSHIRALYERVAEVEQELSFNKDDILYVEDTLPNGNFGYWMAWQLDENARKLGKGQIPSKYMMDQEFYKRRLKHKRSGSKDGKDLVALEALGAESLPITEDGVSLMYQRVQRIECSNPRPVLLLGPLVEVCKDVLVKESPAKFSRCPPETNICFRTAEIMKASQQAIERGVKDCVFIDYKRRSGHFDVTTVASIKEITEKDCHCLLDIAPYAIERLHSVHIYPIIVFIRYKNAKQLLIFNPRTSLKHSKEQFEAAQKIEQDYSRFFTGVVQAGSVSDICTQIVNVVEQEQNRVLWIP